VFSFSPSDPEPKESRSSYKAHSPTIKEESEQVKSVRLKLKCIENGIGGLDLGFSVEITEMLKNIGIDEEKRLDFIRTKQRLELVDQLKAVQGEIEHLEEDETVKKELNERRESLEEKIKQAGKIHHVPPMLSGDEKAKVTPEEIRMKLEEVSRKFGIFLLFTSF
jgi:DNA-binding transcriptional MerR regulator